MIYLDNAATTKVSDSVLEAMLPYFKEKYGNAGSLHQMGSDAAEALREARRRCAAPINADPDDIIFTSGGSEANNLVLFGLTDHLMSHNFTHIITTAVEHPSVLRAAELLAEFGFKVDYVMPQEDGSIRVEDIFQKVNAQTGLISVMAVNNETGNLYDIAQIGNECAKRGILFHTDFVQAYGNLNIDVQTAGIDFLSVSGHKFHAPKGAGFLYAKHKEFLVPLILGGGQEFGIRPGTENIPAIVGMGVAAKEAYENDTVFEGYSEMGMDFLHEVYNRLDGNGVHINGVPYMNSKTINLRFDGVDGQTLVLLLSGKGLCISAGSACSEHSSKPSHVLTAMGLSEEEARSSVRVSFSRYTTKEDVCRAGSLIAGAVEVLRAHEAGD